MGQREPGSVDPVAVLEAAYRLDASDPEWLGGLADELRLALDRGYGVQVGLYHHVAGQTRPLLRTALGTSDVTIQWQQAIYERVHREARCTHIHRHGPVFTVRSLFANPSAMPPSKSGEPVDFLSVRATDGSPFVLTATGPTDRPVRVHRREREVWQRIGAHVSAAYRLRRNLRGFEPDAILDSDGRALHLEGEARGVTLRDALRDAVRRRERARSRHGRGEPEDALALWDALVEGRWSIVDRFETDGRRYVVAHRNAPEHPDPRALTPTERNVAKLAAQALPNKVIAYQLGMASSTVATHLARALRKLGLRQRGELAPWLDARARVRLMELGEEGLAIMEQGGEASILRRLTETERAVASAAANGRSDREIAADRGRSVHTVVNQLRSACAKLGVSTRHELAALVHGTVPAAACGGEVDSVVGKAS